MLGMIEDKNGQFFQFTDKFDYIEGDMIDLRILTKARGNDVINPYYWYDIIDKKTQSPIGKISIRIGSNYHTFYNGNIGYEIEQEHRGHHFAYYASKMVLRVAKHHEMKELYITCGESNLSSRRTIERLGAKLLTLTEVPKDYFGYYKGIEKIYVYRLLI